MDNAERMALYGPCATCGAPRDARIVTSDDGEMWELVCTADPTHDPH